MHISEDMLIRYGIMETREGCDRKKSWCASSRRSREVASARSSARRATPPDGESAPDSERGLPQPGENPVSIWGKISKGGRWNVMRCYASFARAKVLTDIECHAIRSEAHVRTCMCGGGGDGHLKTSFSWVDG